MHWAKRFEEYGKHIGHNLTILPVLDKEDDCGEDFQRLLVCEDCYETIEVIDNPEPELEG